VTFLLDTDHVTLDQHDTRLSAPVFRLLDQHKSLSASLQSKNRCVDGWQLSTLQPVRGTIAILGKTDHAIGMIHQRQDIVIRCRECRIAPGDKIVQRFHLVHACLRLWLLSPCTGAGQDVAPGIVNTRAIVA